jgi:hypothetical protein
MRVKIGLLMVAVLGLVAVGAVRADGPAEREQALLKENAQLKAQVEALRAEVKALREQLQARPNVSVVPYGELKGLPGGLRFAPPATEPGAVVPPSGAVQGMPEGTVRREFNGSAYYVIPMRGEK